MKHIYINKSLIIILFGLFFLATMVKAEITPETALENTQSILKVKIQRATQAVTLSAIRINKSQKPWKLVGKVKRRTYQSKVSQGVINYSINDKQGQLIQQGRVDYSPALSLRRWKHGSQFSIILPENLTPGSQIILSWVNKQF